MKLNECKNKCGSNFNNIFKRPGMYQEIIDTMKKIRQVLIDEDWELDIEEELK